jgi:hypothetical protein
MTSRILECACLIVLLAAFACGKPAQPPAAPPPTAAALTCPVCREPIEPGRGLKVASPAGENTVCSPGCEIRLSLAANEGR